MSGSLTEVSTLLPRLRAAQDRMVADVRALVGCESPSDDLAATSACLDVVAELTRERIADADARVTEHVIDGRRHLVWAFGGPTQVLLVGHCDTVWPLGTLDRWPFAVQGDRATGPGIFDMKAGLVQMIHALAALDDRTGVTMVVTSDEELGSATSRELIEREAAGARAAIVLEASAGGAVKTARKGASLYRLEVTGRAAHAGLEPEAGVNATVEAAHQILAIAALGDAAAGTTVIPTATRSGRTTNTVPDSASIAVDARATDRAEQRRVDEALRALTPVVAGAGLTLHGGINRPPLDRESSAGLFATAVRLATRLGLDPLRGVSVGGASDGNFTAGVGTPTIDGFGAVGDHAHAEGEWASVSAMSERAALLAALIDAVRYGDETRPAPDAPPGKDPS